MREQARCVVALINLAVTYATPVIRNDFALGLVSFDDFVFLCRTQYPIRADIQALATAVASAIRVLPDLRRDAHTNASSPRGSDVQACVRTVLAAFFGPRSPVHAFMLLSNYV